MLFERTAIAKRPDAAVEGTLEALRDEDRMSPDLVFRDPYVLDFLGLPSDFSEAELEAAILRKLKASLLELGQGSSPGRNGRPSGRTMTASTQLWIRIVLYRWPTE